MERLAFTVRLQEVPLTLSVLLEDLDWRISTSPLFLLRGQV